MEHLFLYRMQEHELTMRQMVEEINLGNLNILRAAAKYQVNRNTVKRWLAEIEDEKQRTTNSQNNAPKTVVEQIATRADKLEEKVKELEKAFKEVQPKALYYSTLVKVAEQELGIDVEKKSVTKQSDSSKCAIRMCVLDNCKDCLVLLDKLTIKLFIAKQKTT